MFGISFRVQVGTSNAINKKLRRQIYTNHCRLATVLQWYQLLVHSLAQFQLQLHLLHCSSNTSDHGHMDDQLKHAQSIKEKGWIICYCTNKPGSQLCDQTLIASFSFLRLKKILAIATWSKYQVESPLFSLFCLCWLFSQMQ